MFKILTIGVLLFLFYRLLENPGKKSIPQIKHEDPESESDDFIDYEEIDE